MRATLRRLMAWMALRPALGALALLSPGAGFLLVFFLIPLALVLGCSVLLRGMYGGVEWEMTAESYQLLMDPLYIGIIVKTLFHTTICTTLSLLFGFPVAWAIASSKAWRSTLMLLVVLPSYTSFLVRMFAMIFLLRDSGLINEVLLALGVIDEPIKMLYTSFAVQLGMVYGFLPFMVLPIYSSLEKIDVTLLEAAEVLGARPWTRFWKVVVPLAMPGIAAGCLLVFIPALGTFLVSDLLGGAKEMLLGNLVQNQFTTARNWPFGSAISTVVMSGVLAVVWVQVRRGEAR